MVKLYCLLVGIGMAGKRFAVTMEGGEGRDTVSELKDAIEKTNNHKIKCNAKALKVFLAVKDGKWLDSESKDVEQLQNGEETALFEELTQGGDLELPASRSLYTLLQTMPDPSTDQIHVLVTVAQPPVVYTPAFDLVRGEKLLHFLEGEMNHKDILPSSHVLDEESLKCPLVGRDEAIEKVASSFMKTIRTAKSGYPDSNRPVLPVCAGMSGLGKTRMLEEGSAILQNMMKLNAEDVTASVIVPYTDEYKPQPVERSLPIEASFSWRMLYRFFLAGNCSLPFEEWIRSRLSVNACHLTFETAVAAIELKLRKKRDSAVQFYLFLGIDDYEMIEKLGARRSYPDTSTLKDPLLVHELVDAIVGVLCAPLPRLIVLPMLAGTNLGVGRYPSYYVTYPLSLNVLTMDEIFEVAGGDPSFAELLEYPQTRRDLMLLSGVPKWTVEYFTGLKEIKVVSMDNIQTCFKRVWAKFVENHWSSLDLRTRIRLVAYAVLGGSIRSHNPLKGTTTWSELLNSSACFVVQSQRNYAHDEVRVPYALVWGLALGHAEMETDVNLTIEEETFVKSLRDLYEYVDKTMFDRAVWESSAMFSACFYAVRINALLVLGRAEIGLDMLFRGARMDRGMKFISVKLVPSRVFPCAEKFDASTPATISRQENPSETIDWTSRGCIAVNIGGGAGTDIFFALEKATRPGDLILPGNLIVFVDQRKRRFRELQPSNPDEYLNEMSACPSFLQERKARLVRGILDCDPKDEEFAVPFNSLVVSRSNTEFYGTLAQHPACSPKIPVDSAGKTVVKSLVYGNSDQVNEAFEA